MDPKVELLAWTAVSLASGTLGATWLERTALAGNGLVRELLRFARMICIPFAALVRGASGRDVMALGVDAPLVDQFLGFDADRWITGAGAAAAVTGVVLIVLWLAGRSLRDVPSAWPGIGPAAFRDAPYHEVHWAFYRAAPSLWLSDPVVGVLAGIGLVALEWSAHARMGELLRTLDGRRRIAVRIACVLSSGILYLATRNLWLMMAANLAIQLAGSRLVAAPAPPRPA